MSTGNYELGAFDRSIEQTIANKIIERHIYEAHGSIHHLQYLRGCKESIWSADDFKPVIDTERLGPVHSSRFVFTSWNLDVGHESTDVER